MSGTTTTAALSAYNHVQDKPLSSLIAELLIEHGGKWEGTAHDLVVALNLNVVPRVLAVKLKKAKDDLKKVGVSIRYKRLHGYRIIQLLLPSVSNTELTKASTLSQTTSLEGNAKTEFPFSWPYGSIKELSTAEKEEVNRLRHQGRKQYRKPCSLCGEEGQIEFRKVSDGNPCLICNPCAEKYVRSAMKLQQQEDF
jgi:hypothetical protein